MKWIAALTLLLALVMTGCSSDAGSADSPDNDVSANSNSAAGNAENTPANGEATALTADNTKIEFVGIHVGDKPDPRKGGFGSFTGQAVVADGKLTGVTIEIETASMTTEIEKLTTHLKSADFFDVRQHPKASFKSTSVEDDGDTVKITGELTLLGVTKSISFPATVSTTDGLKLNAEFTIDRTEFGMDYSPDRVAAEVSMTVTVGG